MWNVATVSSGNIYQCDTCRVWTVKCTCTSEIRSVADKHVTNCYISCIWGTHIGRIMVATAPTIVRGTGWGYGIRSGKAESNTINVSDGDGIIVAVPIELGIIK